MIDPARCALYVPPGLADFKLNLFNRIGRHIEARGGRMVLHDITRLDNSGLIPIVGCTPELRPHIDRWTAEGRQWIYWDRGYCDRVFATCLPVGVNMGYYRWHVGAFQARKIRDVPDDRWRKLRASHVVRPWQKDGKHIVIAAPTRTYGKFHGTRDWIANTIDALARVTDRQLVIRDKEQYKRRPIQRDLEGAHCLVTHGSNAAVEAVILGCPVFVDASSAAALMGRTDLKYIESPAYPDREKWLHSLAYDQFTERELCDGTLWRCLA